MTCNKCDDIHQAQKEGKTQNSCECDCHHNNTRGYYYPWTNGCGCCPCTDPNYYNKPMHLVCNCPCHNTQYAFQPFTTCGTTRSFDAVSRGMF